MRGVIRRRTSSGSMFNVARSQSANTGSQPAWTMAFAVAQKVIAVVITSAPGGKSSTRSARCSAAVHELTATAAGAAR